MRHIRWSRVGAAAAALVALSLAGCVVYPARVGYVGDVVYDAPPAPIVETYGVAPGPGYFWIGGYWNWVGGRHEWVGGHWAEPRRGYRWEPHRWEHAGGGWRQRPGHWEHDRR